MIAIKSLKYIIWDYCLTRLFDGFQKNLKYAPMEKYILARDLYPGKKLHKIIRHSHLTWFDCIVNKIYRCHPDNGYCIEFEYRYTQTSSGEFHYPPGGMLSTSRSIQMDDNHKMAFPLYLVEF